MGCLGTKKQLTSTDRSARGRALRRACGNVAEVAGFWSDSRQSRRAACASEPPLEVVCDAIVVQGAGWRIRPVDAHQRDLARANFRMDGCDKPAEWAALRKDMAFDVDERERPQLQQHELGLDGARHQPDGGASAHRTARELVLVGAELWQRLGPEDGDHARVLPARAAATEARPKDAGKDAVHNSQGCQEYLSGIPTGAGVSGAPSPYAAREQRRGRPSPAAQERPAASAPRRTRASRALSDTPGRSFRLRPLRAD
eukprot:scaffold36558_cov85-Phaeocystis_antarctica.AAC.1